MVAAGGAILAPRRRGLPSQAGAALAEVFAAALVVGQDAAEGLPVVAAVAAVAQVDQLVDHDVVDQPHGGLDDAPVQADGAGAALAFASSVANAPIFSSNSGEKSGTSLTRISMPSATTASAISLRTFSPQPDRSRRSSR